MNKRTQQKEATRLKLLTVSLTLFVQKGYEGVTVRDIAAAADVTPGLLFYHFPSKQALLEELVSMASDGANALTALLRSDKPPLEVFENIATFIMRSLEETKAKQFFMLMGQVLTYKLIPDAAKLPSLQIIRLSQNLIRKGQRQGVIKKGNPLALSVAFWGSFQGIAETLVWLPNTPIPEAATMVDILRA